MEDRDGAAGGAAAHVVFGEANTTGWLNSPNMRWLDDDADDPQADDDRFLPRTRRGKPSVTVIPVHARDGRYYLDAAYTREVRFTGAVNRATAIDYYRRAVRLSRYQIVAGIERHVEEQGLKLTGWRKEPLLARSFPLVLRDGRAIVSGQAVRLDPELGIIYEHGTRA
jgi:CRISPR-associated endonuclease/helicase Cas3